VASALLALAASVSWGIGDFSGGLVSRRLPVAGVTFLQHSAGLATVAVAALVVTQPLSGRALALGALGGLFSACGVLSYYRGLAIGTMSVVSPLAACGAIVTVAVSLATGERPSPVALLGAVIALVGAVLASFQEHARGGSNRQAVLLGALTALMFGFQLYFFGRASDDGGPISAVLGARIVSAFLLGAFIVTLRPAVDLSRRGLAVAVVVTGILVATANVLYGLSAERGLIAIASVLASLYPVTTLFLAYMFLDERLTAIQRIGVVVALTGIVLTVVG
jgi:drug/metabolite transporter (DMT)-like permease